MTMATKTGAVRRSHIGTDANIALAKEKHHNADLLLEARFGHRRLRPAAW
jgi:hypothetical protein